MTNNPIKYSILSFIAIYSLTGRWVKMYIIMFNNDFFLLLIYNFIYSCYQKKSIYLYILFLVVLDALRVR